MNKVSAHWLTGVLLFAWISLCGASHSLAEPEQGVAATNPQVRRYSDLTRLHLKRGDLTNARKTAIRAWEAAQIEPRFPADGVPLWFGYLFPEGEALRFFIWERASRLLYVELRDGSVTLPWQAHVKEGATGSFSKADTISKYITASYLIPNRAGVDAEVGQRPMLDRPLSFFQTHPSVGMILYGQVTRDGKIGAQRSLDVTGREMQRYETVVKIAGEKAAGPVR
jgi:hypothetical protein